MGWRRESGLVRRPELDEVPVGVVEIPGVGEHPFEADRSVNGHTRRTDPLDLRIEILTGDLHREMNPAEPLARRARGVLFEQKWAAMQRQALAARGWPDGKPGPLVGGGALEFQPDDVRVERRGA